MNFTSTIICGRIGKHAPVLKTAGNSSYAGFTVAVNTGFGERQLTTWYNVHLWGKAGEVFAKYAVNGQEVLVRGEHRCEKYEGKDGATREKWVLHCFQGELGEKPRQSAPRGGGTKTLEYTDYQSDDSFNAVDDTPF